MIGSDQKDNDVKIEGTFYADNYLTKSSDVKAGEFKFMRQKLAENLKKRVTTPYLGRIKQDISNGKAENGRSSSTHPRLHGSGVSNANRRSTLSKECGDIST